MLLLTLCISIRDGVSWAWQWYTCLLKSVAGLGRYCERFFITTSVIFHFDHFPWSSSLFTVAELANAFLPLQMYQTFNLATPDITAVSLMHFWFFSLMMPPRLVSVSLWIFEKWSATKYKFNSGNQHLIYLIKTHNDICHGFRYIRYCDEGLSINLLPKQFFFL